MKADYSDVVGTKYCKLTAIKLIQGDRRTKALCRCDCGNEVIVPVYKLRSGHNKSCGCSHGELISKSKTRHGMADTHIHIEWMSMRNRCKNPSNISFKYYGARGIGVCDEWDKSFDAFYDYVSKLKNYGKETYTLDRIDNDKGYEPGNVRWASKTEQSRNRRNVYKIDYNGKVMTFKELSILTGISEQTLRRRYKRGWTLEKLTQPI